jgi:hypothetical protein
MKQKYKYLFLLLAAISFLTNHSCRKENDKDNPIKKNAPDGIYMAGQKSNSAKGSNSNKENSIGCIWVNGILYDMGDIYIDDVKVFNDTIYSCGRNFSDADNSKTACYFIGDQKYNFNISKTGADIFSIWVDGRTVYVAGQDSSKPCYWVNGIKHNLPSEGLNGSSNDIIIKNNIVYCGGNVYPYYQRGCYWINDQLHYLEDLKQGGGNVSWASGMFINGSDVYISGEVDGIKGYGEACYWKNGIKQVLSFSNMGFVHNTIDGSVQMSEADDIYVYNEDVYVSGRYSFGDVSIPYTALEMCYWKNNDSRTDIAAFENPIRPKIVVDADDIYFIAGTEFWKNDKQVPIENQENYTISSLYMYEAKIADY